MLGNPLQGVGLCWSKVAHADCAKIIGRTLGISWHILDDWLAS